MLEEYPLSGVTVWFDAEGRVSKLNFLGAVGQFRYGVGAAITSERPVLLGVTAQMDEAAFRRALGPPKLDWIDPATVEIELGRTLVRERRCIRKLSGFVLDAMFASEDQATKRQPQGGLIWFDVFRGL
jgi:hypothetical protein